VNTVDVPVMCAWCGHPYWLTEATVEGELTWELSDEDGEIVEAGYGEPKCPLCGGPLVEDPLEEPDPPAL
jgi:hypothetical protein